jgi:hypothetical protein
MIFSGRTITQIIILFFCVCTATAVAQLPSPYFFDDFEDGNAEDGKPVKWSPWLPFVDGTRVVKDGSYVITPSDQVPQLPGYDPSKTESDSTIEGVTLQDVSIRTLVRAFEPGNYWIGVAARDTSDDDGLNGSNIGTGIRTDGTVAVWTLNTGNIVSNYQEVQTEFDPTSQDVHLQFDLFGRDVNLTAWANGTVKPSDPQIRARVSSSFLRAGELGIWDYVEVGDYNKPVAFRHFAVLPTSTSPTMPGDFDDDFQLTVSDIDNLASTLRAGGADLKFDSNYDGVLNTADHQAWIRYLKRTWFGDADLNGEFNSSDLVVVFTAGKYETDSLATWSEGDFNGDQRFGSGDLVTAFQDGGYEKGPRAAVSAVPEPAGVVLLLFGLFSTVRKWHVRREGLQIQ